MGPTNKNHQEAIINSELPEPVEDLNVDNPGTEQVESREYRAIEQAHTTTSKEQIANQPKVGGSGADDDGLADDAADIASHSTTAQIGVQQTQDDTTTAAPDRAQDVDLIEKEWVDKAKKVVESTKGNPYEQEKEVSKLQAAYLKKRYGKTIKTTSD